MRFILAPGHFPVGTRERYRERKEGGNNVKSYALAILLAMLVAAGYAFQNTGDVVVRFIIWEKTLPQGLWDILLFAAGGLLMWIVSLASLVEVRGALRRKIKDQEERIRVLEQEKQQLLDALKTPPAETAQVAAGTPEKEVPASGDMQ
jgi:putative membrane protein